MWRKRFLVTAAVLLHASAVLGQSSIDLPGVISAVQGLASDFGTPTSAPSSTSSPTSTSATSTSASPTSSSTSITSPTSSAASTTTGPVSSASADPASTSEPSSPDSGGLDPRTRTIILAVCIPVGLIVLGVLIGCLICCCMRRRRRSRRVKNSETREIGASEWRHGDGSHHGYVSTDSDLTRHPRIPVTHTQPHHTQPDATPLMSEGHEKREPVSTVHPAYRTNSWGSLNNVNARNPFTPQPPVTRKPVPSHRGNGHAALAAGAGAAVGAAATHLHHQDHQTREAYHYDTNQHRPLSSHPTEGATFAPGNERPLDFRDSNRPPTPFGLSAFGGAEKRQSKGAIVPTVAAHQQQHPNSHMIDHPSDAQRRSLQEREMLATDLPIPERSPKRASFGNEYRGTPTDYPRSPYNDSGYSSQHTPANARYDDSDGSNESWRSAQASQTQPTQHHHWDDGRQYMPEPRHSEDHGYSETPLVAPNAVWNNNHRNSADSSGSSRSRMREPQWKLYGPDGNPRQSFGADGKPRRLRFSDMQPEEYHYDREEHYPVGQAL